MPGDPSNNSILSATPAFGGIDVSWSYPATNPQAVAYTKIYRGVTSSFSSAIQIAEVGGAFFFDKLDSGLTYYYWIRIISVNGTVGELIGPASAMAKPTIEAMIELLTGQIDAGLLATSLRNEIDRIQTLYTDLVAEVTSRENGETTLSDAMVDVQAGVAETLTFLASEQTSRVAGDSALATSIDLVAVTSAANLAAATSALSAEIDAVEGGFVTLASAIDTVEAEAAGNLAAAQTTLSASIATVDGKATAIGALYTAKVTVNGLVGGFGIYNSGAEVEAGFDVDTFWIGRTSADKRKPFIVSGGVVYIDEAAILSLSANKITAGSLNSAIVFAGKLLVGAAPAVSGTTMTGAGAVINSNGTFAIGNAPTNITYNGTVMTLNGNVVATANIQDDAITTSIAGNLALTDATITETVVFTSSSIDSTVSGVAKPIIVDLNMGITLVNVTGSTTLTARLKVNGVTERTYTEGSTSGTVRVNLADTIRLGSPPTGAVTFTITLVYTRTNALSEASLSANLFAMATKK